MRLKRCLVVLGVLAISGPALLLSEWVLLFLGLRGAPASAGGNVVLRLIKEEPPMGPGHHRTLFYRADDLSQSATLREDARQVAARLRSSHPAVRSVEVRVTDGRPAVSWTCSAMLPVVYANVRVLRVDVGRDAVTDAEEGIYVNARSPYNRLRCLLPAYSYSCPQ